MRTLRTEVLFSVFRIRQCGYFIDWISSAILAVLCMKYIQKGFGFSPIFMFVMLNRRVA